MGGVEPRRLASAAQLIAALRGASRSPSTLTADGRDYRTPRLVLARQVSFMPDVRRSAGGASPRNQQTGEPLGRRPQLGDNAPCVERAAVDEQEPSCAAAQYDASCLVLLTIVRMQRSRPAISTISCSSPSCVRRPSLPCARPDQTD